MMKSADANERGKGRQKCGGGSLDRREIVNKEEKREYKAKKKAFFEEHKMFYRPLMADVFDVVEEARSEPNSRTPFDDIKVIEDVTYKIADGLELKMDVYVPSNPVAGAAVLDIPGGGWMIHNRKRRAGYAKCSAALGATVFVIDHRLCPSQCFFPYNLADCIDAFNFVAEHAEEYGVDPNNITVTGDSSGGHLTAELAVAATNDAFREEMPVPALATKPAAVIFVSGFFSFKVMFRIPFTHTLIARYVSDTRSRSAFKKWKYADKIEPYDFITEDFPPAYNNGGGFDMLCAGEAKRMAQKLDSLGVENAYYVGKNILNGGHCYLLRFPKKPARRDALKLYEWYADRLALAGKDGEALAANRERVRTFFTQYKRALKEGVPCRT